MKKPLFIAIEGGEGSGKSSLLAALKESMADRVVTTREPGGSPLGAVIRETILKHPLAAQATPATMFCGMFMSRFELLDKIVGPALAAGVSVVTDRFDASTYAYNVWAQSGGKLEKQFWALREAIPRLPDLYVFIDVDPAEGLRRARARNASKGDGNHFDDRDIEFHKKVKEGYLKFMRSPAVENVVIDANRPLEEVKKDFLAAIEWRIDQASR